MSMLWQSLTEQARGAVIDAQETAAEAGHPYVSPEHLLLGLLDQRASRAFRVLEHLGADPSRIRHEIEAHIGIRGFSRLSTREVTLDSRFKRVLKFASEEALRAEDGCIGTEHLLLGILREEDGVAVQTLAKSGLDPVSICGALSQIQVEAPDEIPVQPDVAEQRAAIVQPILFPASPQPSPGPLAAPPSPPVSAAMPASSPVPPVPAPAFASPVEVTQPAGAAFHVGKFSDPGEAEAWLNRLALQDGILQSATASGSYLWLIVRCSAPTAGDTNETAAAAPGACKTQVTGRQGEGVTGPQGHRAKDAEGPREGPAGASGEYRETSFVDAFDEDDPGW